MIVYFLDFKVLAINPILVLLLDKSIPLTRNKSKSIGYSSLFYLNKLYM